MPVAILREKPPHADAEIVENPRKEQLILSSSISAVAIEHLLHSFLLIITDRRLSLQSGTGSTGLIVSCWIV